MTRTLIGVYAIWVSVVVILPLLGFFRVADEPLPPLALTDLHIGHDPTPGFALTSLIFLPGCLFLIWYRRSERLRCFVRSFDGRTVTWLQSIRMAAPVFYMGYVLHVYPAAFGVPAVVMDSAWGYTTPFIASLWSRNPFPRQRFVAWHVLGIIELIVLASLRIMTLRTPLGVLAGDLTSEGLNVLPWSLLPTGVAANLIIFHLMGAILGLRRPDGAS